jgi:hypothetical protein
MFQILTFKKRKKRCPLPCPKYSHLHKHGWLWKKSTKAKSQRKLSMAISVSIDASADITDDRLGTYYTVSKSEYLYESEGSGSSDEENNILQSIEAMQTLYSIFLLSYLKAGGKANMVSAMTQTSQIS